MTLKDFNPRTPCGVRLIRRIVIYMTTVFQPTHPLRGATSRGVSVTVVATISTHAPLAGCDEELSKALIKRLISTHAPLAGCDIKHASLNETRQTFQPTHPLRGATVRIMSRGSSVGFQPTHPLRGATSRYHQSPKHSQISTHAPLAGCDLVIFVPSSTDSYFNPRTPCGVRHISLQRKLYKIAISTHAPLAGCDGGKPPD